MTDFIVGESCLILNRFRICSLFPSTWNKTKFPPDDEDNGHLPVPEIIVFLGNMHTTRLEKKIPKTCTTWRSVQIGNMQG